MTKEQITLTLEREQIEYIQKLAIPFEGNISMAARKILIEHKEGWGEE